MKIHHLTSDAFKGFVEFQFDDNSLLVKYEIHADLSELQQVFILKHLPREVQELKSLIAGSPSAKLTEIKQEVNFEMFWNRYDDKINSSKKKTRKIWDKMTQTDQARAYYFIDKYFGSIPQGTRKKYAETYLNAELWAN